MSDAPLLPPRLTLLGESMQSVLQRLRRDIDKPVRPVATVVSMTPVISNHTDALQNTIVRLEDWVGLVMSEVVSNETASDGQVFRAVGRFEAVLDDLVSNYQQIRALNVQGMDIEARDLLAGMYRHTLVEIRDWLLELVETLADPLAALEKRGLPTRGKVELPLVLTLTAAPQFAELLRWAERQSVPRKTATPSGIRPQPRKSGLGFWDTVFAVALGCGIGEALFRDDDCGGNDGGSQ